MDDVLVSILADTRGGVPALLRCDGAGKERCGSRAKEETARAPKTREGRTGDLGKQGGGCDPSHLCAEGGLSRPQRCMKREGERDTGGSKPHLMLMGRTRARGRGRNRETGRREPWHRGRKRRLLLFLLRALEARCALRTRRASAGAGVCASTDLERRVTRALTEEGEGGRGSKWRGTAEEARRQRR